MDKNSQEIIVKFDEVTKQYGDLVVLDKLNLNIKKNEMVSIIGPSGSGKTTVLRVLMTLEKINGGVIHLDGEPLTHMHINGKLIEANEKYLRDRRSKIFPSLKKHTLSEISLANPIWCVTIIIVKLCSLFNDLITFKTSPTTSGSKAEVISSKSITFGLIAKALAIATRCCWPPDNLEGC